MALVGATGSGKSTLINLLARLHDPPRGTVFVDGVDVRDIPLATLRGAIGFVPQEPFLFSDTLADNVAFGLDARTGQARRQAAPGLPGEAGQAGRRVALRRSRRADRDAAAVARLDKDVADFPRATTRWSASAASRSPAARNSGRPSRARWSSIRAS